MSMHYLSHLAELGATDLHPQGRRATAQLVHYLDLQPGQQILEVGCGTGETMVRVSLACNVTVTGVDVLPEMLRVARSRLRVTGLHHTAQVAQVQAGAPLPFPDGSYDRLYTESVLGFQDTASAGALLAEIFRLLKVGGRYVANEAVWKPSIPAGTAASIYASCLADFGLCHASQQNWSAEDWCAAMRRAGFQILTADVLADHGVEEREALDSRVRLRLLLSQLLTSYYRVKGCLSPRLLRQGLSYGKRLQQHKAEGRSIEARLFVLQKPA
jgi:ubiquinone/menaquinone biosynthesis C-methylase UbiE